MSVSQGKTSLAIGDILNNVTEATLLSYYLGITTIPVVISSPLRTDNNPSFGIYSPDGARIKYKDFATGDSGGIIDLLKQKWQCSFLDVISKIAQDKKDNKLSIISNQLVIRAITKEHKHSTTYNGNTDLQVRIREWKVYDEEYWNTFGIDKELLIKANVYPISHYIITKNGNTMTFGADKYAYAFAEFKEGKTTIKVYQPFNKSSFKWISKHDRSVLGLWNMMPKKGKVICICSSVKDALCLRANTGIPTICLQGEAYGISITAQEVLKERFDNVCIMLDSDEPGREDAAKLAESTGFINVELPISEYYKDIAEMYVYLNDKDKFKQIIINLFKQTLKL